MIELQGRDIGIADCDFIARGDVPAEVLEQMVRHLEQVHDLDMPDPEALLRRYPDEELPLEKLAATFSGGLDEERRLIIRRLREVLDIDAQ